MAKVTFTKLKLTSKKDDVKILKWGDNDIEVKQYLPLEEKLILIGEPDAFTYSIDNSEEYIRKTYFLERLRLTMNKK